MKIFLFSAYVLFAPQGCSHTTPPNLQTHGFRKTVLDMTRPPKRQRQFQIFKDTITWDSICNSCDKVEYPPVLHLGITVFLGPRGPLRVPMMSVRPYVRTHQKIQPMEIHYKSLHHHVRPIKSYIF